MPERKPKPIGLQFQGDAATFVAGWPNADHNEPDDRLRAAKLGSGRYLSCPALPEPVETPPAPEPAPETPKLARPAYWWLAAPDRPEAPVVAAEAAVAEASGGAASPPDAATPAEENS